MVAITLTCHHCGSRNLTKYGIAPNGKQKYLFPWLPDQEPEDGPRVAAIAAATRELDEKRGRWLNPEGASEAELKTCTLTNLYNQRPTWLDRAHKKLDTTVLDSYNWPHDITDEDILARLLTLNLARPRKVARGQSARATTKATTERRPRGGRYGE
jgi:hypothetical protein